MITKVTIEEDSLWKKFSKNDINAFYKGYFYSHTIAELVDDISSIPIINLEQLIKKIDGHFALVIVRNDITIISVDKIRTTPLFFTLIEDTFFIDWDPKRLISKNKFVNDINEVAALEISMSGYTIGNKTIFNNLNSLRAGEFAVFSENSFKVNQYFKYYSDENDEKSDHLNMLTGLTVKIFKKMLSDIGNRQIVIPLSAGNDSRLVASLIKELGHDNVICYSYGLSGNFEAETAKLIAEKLNYRWVFIPLVHQKEKQFYKSKEFKDYLKFSETYSSVPYIQSLSTVKYLKELNIIEDDAIFINGNSGDFISGLHLNYLFKNENDAQDEITRKEVILNSIFEKHFSLWGELSSKLNTNLIKKSLWSEIEFQCGSLNAKKNDYSFYEYSEFIDRQSKYVIAGQRAYEFYGYEWRLPLWDNEYLDYWLKVPINHKKNQSLYIDMLKNANFGNVWSNEIPINHKTINPRWLIPIRFLFKIPFALFGQKGKKLWHEFEIILFYYWMDNTRMMSTVSYWRVLQSFIKKPQNHVSWQVIDYLQNIRKK